MEYYPNKYFDVQRKKRWLEIRFSNGVHNYITPEVMNELEGIISGVCQDELVHCAVLRSGATDVFSHGLDIKMINSMSSGEIIEFIAKAGNILSQLNTARIPFIAAVQGDCFGAGLELILSCDMRISTHSSEFAAPEVIYGLVPAGGGIQRLLQLVGRGQASRLLLSGMRIRAGEAARIGLIEETVDEDKLDERCDHLASRIGRIQRPGIIAIKEALSYGINHLFEESVENDFHIFQRESRRDLPKERCHS